jgi:hypothetical protein
MHVLPFTIPSPYQPQNWKLPRSKYQQIKRFQKQLLILETFEQNIAATSLFLADDDTLAESCYICLQGWEIGEEVTTLRCKCLSWAHEAYLAKSVFETGGCPTCRKSILLIDDEIVLGQAAVDGDTEKLRRLLENRIQHSPRGLLGSQWTTMY